MSSLSSPNFASSYSLGSVGAVDGSISYLYSSLPLQFPKDGITESVGASSTQIALGDVIEGYRHLQELKKPDEEWWWEVWHAGKRIDRRDTLLYGRMYLPRSALEALYLRRISPTRQLQLKCVSDARLNNGGTILALLKEDYAKYSMEYLYSTDSGLFGVRGLYNFGFDPQRTQEDAVSGQVTGNTTEATATATLSPPTTSPSDILSSSSSTEGANGRFSAGAELYYGLLNKSGGVSTGLRFTTLPSHTGFPYTMTLTLNPLMGNLSSTYAVKAGRNVSLCSRFNFNFYSYESDLQLGCEIWRRQWGSQETEWARRLIRPGWAKAVVPDEDVTGVLKARVDQDWRIGVLWEGRIKELLFTLGATFDLKRRERILGAVGVELSYSS